MKRPLTDEERKLTKNGIIKLTKEVEEAAENLNVLEKTRSFIELKHRFEISKQAYENYVRPFNQKKEMENVEKQIKYANSQIDSLTRDISIMKDQMKGGVEEKNKKDDGGEE